MTTNMVEHSGVGGMEQQASSGREGRWQECWRGDRLGGIRWAAIFIWAALVLLAESTDLKWNFVGGTADGWGVFFAGAGVIVLLETALRLWMREHQPSWWWTLIGGLVLLWIPSDWEGWYWIWSLVLAAVGVAILRGAFARDRSSGKGNRDGESWRDA